MEWATYKRLSEENFFLVTEGILNTEREIAEKGCERQTDALYETRRFEYPWAFLQIPENASVVLDAGGGPATFQYFMAKYISEVYNVDLNRGWVDKVQGVKKRTGAFKNLIVSTGDLSSLPMFCDKTFDATVCISVIEHSGNAERIIDELLRVTNGPVLITVDIGERDEELMSMNFLHELGDRYGFLVPTLPPGAILRATMRGHQYLVACISLEGGK